MPTEFTQPAQFALRYDAQVGRWSRALASRFVAWLSPLPGQRWLDVGCGTGALTTAILEQAAPSALWGVDAEPQLRERLRSLLPTRPNGSIPLDALAWVIVGERGA